MRPPRKAPAPVNEGEGNKTAAREYNEAQRRFAESGKVEEKARKAEQALDGPEAQALRDAEALGKSRAAGEDPGFGQIGAEEQIKKRAYEIWEHEGRPEGPRALARGCNRFPT
jgi:hypothetical protein